MRDRRPRASLEARVRLDLRDPPDTADPADKSAIGLSATERTADPLRGRDLTKELHGINAREPYEETDPPARSVAITGFEGAAASTKPARRPQGSIPDDQALHGREQAAAIIHKATRQPTMPELTNREEWLVDRYGGDL